MILPDIIFLVWSIIILVPLIVLYIVHPREVKESLLFRDMTTWTGFIVSCVTWVLLILAEIFLYIYFHRG